jgi:prepilin-type N-terminal cleavage/methylation domain-containing protein
MFFHLQKNKEGFTLVELLIVIAIITVLAGVIFVNYESAREQSRDERRISDLAQIEVALRLYVEQYGQDIDCESGLKIDGSATLEILNSIAGQNCDDGQRILNFFAQTMKVVPHDPLGPGNNDYFYYYDNFHDCDSGPNNPDTGLLYAANLESYISNASQVCTTVSGNDGGYMNTSSFGGSISTSRPYVVKTDFSNEI